MANVYGRMHNTIVISSIYAGVLWLLPGALGVSGARSAFGSQNGMGFVMEIVNQVFGISVGL